MIGSTHSRYKTEECVECREQHENVMPCDFSERGTCKCCEAKVCQYHFRETWKTCAKCGRTGCREHFDGMYCFECNEGEK